MLKLKKMNFLENYLRASVKIHEWSDEVVNRLLDSKNLDNDDLTKFVRSIQYNDVEECIIYKNKHLGVTVENGIKKDFNSNIIILNFFCWPNKNLSYYQAYLNTNNKCGKSNCINNKHYKDCDYKPKEENISKKSVCYISNYNRNKFDELFTLNNDDKYFQITETDSLLAVDKDSSKNLDFIFQLNLNKIYRDILDFIGIKLKEPERPVTFMNFSKVIICNDSLNSNEANNLNRLADFFRFFCSNLCLKAFFWIKNGNDVQISLESIITYNTENKPHSSNTELEANTKETDIIKFAMNSIKSNQIFSIEDIQTGIFGDSNNNTRSLEQKPFDQNKTELLKSKF